MTDYEKTTDFNAKDGLTSGNPAKSVLGAELDDEFDAIAVASATKHDSATVATLTAAGIIEIATVAETNTGTDATRAVSPDGLDGWTGSAQIVTLGTVADFTSTGINDDASSEMLKLGTGSIQVGDGSSTESVTIRMRTTTDGTLRVSGGSGTALGANQIFYGESHSLFPDHWRLYASGVLALEHNDTDSEFDFQANDITTTGALTCGALTSTGIDDNATAERVQIADTQMVFSGSLSYYRLVTVGTDNALQFSGGNSINNGSNISIYGSTHANAGDVLIRDDATTTLRYDASGSIWDFQANAITTTGITTTTGLITPANPPASASATGTTGEIRWGDDGGTKYLFVCVATNTWERVALATWGPA